MVNLMFIKLNSLEDIHIKTLKMTISVMIGKPKKKVMILNLLISGEAYYFHILVVSIIILITGICLPLL